MRVQSWQIDRDACKQPWNVLRTLSFQGGGGGFIVDGDFLMASQRVRQGPHPLEGLKQLLCRVGLLSSGISCMQDSRGAGGRGRARKEEQWESLTVHLHHSSERPAELFRLLNEGGWSPWAFFMWWSERWSSNFKISRAKTEEDASVEPSWTARAVFLLLINCLQNSLMAQLAWVSPG